jgi:hypothetical protein
VGELHLVDLFADHDEEDAGEEDVCHDSRSMEFEDPRMASEA